MIATDPVSQDTGQKLDSKYKWIRVMIATNPVLQDTGQKLDPKYNIKMY